MLVIKVMSTHGEKSRRKYFLDFLRICENNIYDTFMIYRKCITVCVGNFKRVDEISGKVAFSESTVFSILKTIVEKCVYQHYDSRSLKLCI